MSKIETLRNLEIGVVLIVKIHISIPSVFVVVKKECDDGGLLHACEEPNLISNP